MMAMPWLSWDYNTSKPNYKFLECRKWRYVVLCHVLASGHRGENFSGLLEATLERVCLAALSTLSAPSQGYGGQSYWSESDIFVRLHH